METYVIQNSHLKVEIASLGAEIQSIFSFDTNKEYMWCGDEEFWGKKSPTLFPVCGRLKEETYTFRNKEYSMKKHGFLQTMDLKPLVKKDDEISLLFSSSEDTFVFFPFKFELLITYKLIDNILIVKWELNNKGSKKIYYSIGGHPAFDFVKATGGKTAYLKFNQTPTTMLDVSSGYYVEGANRIKDIKFEDDKYLKLKDGLFAKDGLFFEKNQLSSIAICNEKKEDCLSVEFTSPVVGIWAPDKKHCPFVCIEPWYGLCDCTEPIKAIEKKKYIQTLEVMNKATLSYKIKIIK